MNKSLVHNEWWSFLKFRISMNNQSRLTMKRMRFEKWIFISIERNLIWNSSIIGCNCKHNHSNKWWFFVTDETRKMMRYSKKVLDRKHLLICKILCRRTLHWNYTIFFTCLMIRGTWPSEYLHITIYNH